MSENDPNRIDRPPAVDPDSGPPIAPTFALGALVVAAIIALGFAIWTWNDAPPTTMTNNAPAYRAPTSAPAAPPSKPNQ